MGEGGGLYASEGWEGEGFVFERGGVGGLHVF